MISMKNRKCFLWQFWLFSAVSFTLKLIYKTRDWLRIESTDMHKGGCQRGGLGQDLLDAYEATQGAITV